MMPQHLAIAPVTPRRQHQVGNLSTLWHTKEGTDVTIRCADGIELKAHRLVLTRSPWMAAAMEMQRPSPDTKMTWLLLEEDSLLVRPLVAFCYGVELPPLKKGSKTEAQLRTLVDLYHANHYKYRVPRLSATCEAALTNLGDVIESPCKIGQKSPMHGVISRMLGHQREGRSAMIYEGTGMSNPGRPLHPGDPFEVEREREPVATPGTSNTSACDRYPLNEYHLTLLEEEHERRDSVVSDASTTANIKGKFPADARHSGTTDVEPERQGIAIPGVPHVARLRERSPGGTPYSSPRLFDEIMTMLGSDGERSPMLDAHFPGSRAVIERESDTFRPDSPDAMTTAWGLSMSPLLDGDFNPSKDTLHLVPAPLRPSSKGKSNSAGAASSSFYGREDTLHLVPAPLRPSRKQQRKSDGSSVAGSSLYGPRPLPSGHASKRSVTMPEDLATTTPAHGPSQAPVKEGMFSSIRGATRRAFNGKSKR